MNTKILRIYESKNEEGLTDCGKVLKNGGLVAFPTETVYGLGANALDPFAVGKIFAAKGRPSDNPLIVHVSKISHVHEIAKEIPKEAKSLMDKFWPGPLTLIFKKKRIIHSRVTGGLSTVAIRMPNHPVALKLIEYADVPVAAPSANISGRPSPTKAKHVIEDLFGKVDVIIDGGDCEVGIESTVLDITGDTVVILRTGGITKEEIEKVINKKVEIASIFSEIHSDRPRAPGMKYTHYSPNAKVLVVRGFGDDIVREINRLVYKYTGENKKVGVICTDETEKKYTAEIIKSLGSSMQQKKIAASLFRTFREMDEDGVDIILAEAIEERGLGVAVMNRLIKASGYNIIDV